MPIRVTQTMLNTQFLQNLSNNYNRMGKLENALSTGRIINRPSDDPVGLSFSMRYRSHLSENEQYQKNLDSANSWLGFTDTALDQAGQIFSRVRELTVQALQGTNPQQSMDAVAAEVDQLNEQMVVIGNSQFNGKYVFNGQFTDQKPYEFGKATTTFSDGFHLLFEFGVNVRIPVNSTGNEVFGMPSEHDNAFRVLDEISASLKKGDQKELGDVLAKLDTRMSKFLDVRSEIGARINRVQLAESRLKDIEINVTELQSKTEDADLAEVITKLKMDENVYQASLSAGAKLIKQSLVDFLR